MNAPFSLSGAVTAARIVDGLPAAIDAVAARADPRHAFLRHGWYAAAVEAYGGAPRTLLVEAGMRPLLALPMVAAGPAWLGLATVPGSYWPFRSPVADAGAGAAVFDAAVTALAAQVRGLRLGPVPDGDPIATGLVEAARQCGWTIVDRAVGATWLLDLTEEPWPRTSTLRKNRFHEKHLGSHGALDWGWVGDGDWPAAFDTLAEVEALSWHGREADAKFSGRHGTFWRAAARDPELAARMRAALLRVDGRAAAFSFDIDAGARLYAVANSYDPAYAKHSPGKLLQYRNLVDARDRGARLVDWGAGDSGYKRTLGAVEGPVLRDWLLLSPRVPHMLARIIARRWRGSGVPG